jgi:Uma2 family endonuclease
MPTVIAEGYELSIPEWVTNLAAFRQWVAGPEFPRRADVWWLRDRVRADMTREPDLHVQVRAAVERTLLDLCGQTELGRYLARGACLVNVVAGFAGRPDGMYISLEGRDAGRYRLNETEHDRAEVEGTPDMVLEVLGDSSANKDLVLLRRDYALAEVREYWLVDARTEKPVLEILKAGAKGFTAARKQAGWIKSAVFGRSFRLVRTKGGAGCRLEMR